MPTTAATILGKITRMAGIPAKAQIVILLLIHTPKHCQLQHLKRREVLDPSQVHLYRALYQAHLAVLPVRNAKPTAIEIVIRIFIRNQTIALLLTWKMTQAVS